MFERDHLRHTVYMLTADGLPALTSITCTSDRRRFDLSQEPHARLASLPVLKSKHFIVQGLGQYSQDLSESRLIESRAALGGIICHKVSHWNFPLDDSR